MDALSRIQTHSTPVTRPIPGRATDQVRNNAGGYTFAKDVWARLEDFIILGTTGGTYYVDEKKHTYDNAQVVLRALAEDGVRAVTYAREISIAAPVRAPKNFPALFVIAAALASTDLETRRAARTSLPYVARTTDHLSHLFGYYKNLHGKTTPTGPKVSTGRLSRGAFADWFTVPDIDQVAFRACKARARKTGSGEDFSLRDILRIAKPKLDGRASILAGWLVGKVPDSEARSHFTAIDNFLTAQAVTTEVDAIHVIASRRVPWEFLPSSVLDSPDVWDQLIDTIGMTALIRNLARMTRIGTLKPMSGTSKRVVRRLTDADALAKARIHPMDLMLAMKVYSSGRSQPHPKATERLWTPDHRIVDALDQAYELSFGHVSPSGSRLLVAVDSSGSMGGASRVADWGGVVYGGSNLGSIYSIANSIALTMLRIDPDNTHVIEVDTSIHLSKLTPRTHLRDALQNVNQGGGTDLSLVASYAQREGLNVDGFFVLTDNETWRGGHPAQTLTAYRRDCNPRAKFAVASMTAAGHTIGDPTDPGVLNVSGFDASMPQVVTDWLRRDAVGC